MTLSSAHLTPEQVAKWVAHQHIQLEAGTFDEVLDHDWIQVASSRTLRKNPSSNWRQDWAMDTFLKALEEFYAVEPKDRFICLDLGRPSGHGQAVREVHGFPGGEARGRHCEVCGKPNHKRRDCTSGHDPKHPDFNEGEKWVGCATYKTIKAWLASHDRAGEHPTLRFN